MPRTIDYTRYYNRWHDDSDAHLSRMAADFSALLAPHLPKDRSAPILEIGCGMGFALAALTKAGYTDVSGFDSDRGQVAAALARGLPAEHVPVENTMAYFAERRGRYAFICCIDVLEHIPIDVQLDFLEAARDSLQPGGLFLCRVPNANSALANRYRYDDWTHHCSFTEASLDFVLFNSGFEPIFVGEAETPARPPYPFIPRRATAHWLLRRAFRTLRRLELACEIGPGHARSIPLGLNIMAVARRADRAPGEATRR